jgi:hypothetical protein
MAFATQERSPIVQEFATGRRSMIAQEFAEDRPSRIAMELATCLPLCLLTLLTVRESVEVLLTLIVVETAFKQLAKASRQES